MHCSLVLLVYKDIHLAELKLSCGGSNLIDNYG